MTRAHAPLRHAPLWALCALLGCGPGDEKGPEADRDGDGYASSVDCDDLDPSRSPGAIEACNDVDDDCDGRTDEAGAEGARAWHADADGDGAGSDESVIHTCRQPEGWLAEGGDCDDYRAGIGPGMPETCDGLDEDCDGLVDEPGALDGMAGYWDADMDGAGDPATSEPVCTFGDGWVANRLDCDDADPTIWAGAPELCDGLDNDCDGEADEDARDGELYYRDADGDRAGDPAVSRLLCQRSSGWVSNAEDCDDTRFNVGPDAEELCDELDNDCDGEADEEAVDAVEWYQDADGDAYGADGTALSACADPWGGGALLGGDCDDEDPAVSPGAEETWYDGWDQDCAGDSDWDADADGYVTSDLADPDEPTHDPGTGAAVDTGEDTEAGDCDDEEAEVFPGQEERCDGVDEDCDGEIDGGATDATTWYPDGDADGYGVDEGALSVCESPGSGWALSDGDCDDEDRAVSPGAEEIWYDGWDQDCAGDSDWDADADGYVTSALADPDEPTYDPGSGELVDDGARTRPGDCDDEDAALSPVGVERCDGVDQDCDGLVDDGAVDAPSWYLDEDGDGWGSSAESVEECEAPSAAWVAEAGDCDDEDPTVSPSADEIWYDGWDQDCGADSDWDADRDGYVTDTLEDEDEPTYDPGSGAVVDDGSDTEGGDCDDGDLRIRPEVGERCDGVDNDCDGEIDTDAPTAEIYYTDEDGDGYGVDGTAEVACRRREGYAYRGGDCDDADAGANPGVEELCGDDNGADDDCDGWADTACNAGWLRYTYGLDADPATRACELVWSTTWTPSSELCDDCDWVFDVALTWLPEASQGVDECPVEAVDLDWTLGLRYRVRLSEKLYELAEDGSWTEWGWASLDTSTGRLDFHDGAYEEETDGLFETDYWQGSAELYELTR